LFALLLLAAAPFAELASGTYDVPAHDFGFVEVSITDWPATLLCSLEVSRGAPVSVAFLTRTELTKYNHGQQPHYVLLTGPRKTARFRQAVPRAGDYAILLINDSGQPSSVRLQAVAESDPERDLTQNAAPLRKLIVIVSSILVFVATVLGSGVGLWRAMRRGSQ
jgi:hypothetical protein